MALITAYEVRKYSPAGANYDTTLLQPFIKVREEYLANKCLTWTFYNSLLSDLVSYSGVDWSSGDSYSVDDIVNDPSTGILYEALQAVSAGTPLTNTSYWQVAPKFSSTANNNLWTGALRDYISFTVYRASLASSTYQGRSQGVMRHIGNNEEAVSYQELSYMSDSLKEAETELYNNLIDYMKRNGVAGWSIGCEDENCNDMRSKTLGFIL